MKKIGIDFGTTNSTLSFYDPDNNRIETFKINNQDYIPSFLAIHKETEEISIGESAKQRQGDEDYDVYKNFKMLLNEKNNDKLKQFGFHNKKPLDITRLFFLKMIEQYEKDQNIKVEKLIITVPEIWLEQNDSITREMLIGVIKELGITVSKSVSEPVAAIAYFTYLYKLRNKVDYSGQVLVCDYGGGTLDLSLCNVESNKIKVLAHQGIGSDSEELGKAGVSYDQNVVIDLYRNNMNDTISKHSQEFWKLFLDFEKRKIIDADKIEKSLKKYFESGGDYNLELFKIDNNPQLGVMTSNLVSTFNDEYKSSLIGSLSSISNSSSSNLKNNKNLKILMVGGFSEFYLVRKTVFDFFNASEDDNRFEHFNKNDRSLSISKGAAVICNDLVEIIPSYPYTMGILAYKPSEGRVEIPIVTKGEKISDFSIIKYCPHKFQINKDLSLNELKIFLFIKGEMGQIDIDLCSVQNLPIEKILPNANNQENTWSVGFSMDEDQIIYFHAKDEKNTSKTSLAQILINMKNVWVKEEK